MGHRDSRGSDLDVDLESGGTTSEEDESMGPSSRDKHPRNLLGRTRSALDAYIRMGDGLNSENKLLNSGEIPVAGGQILLEKMGQDMMGSMGKKLKEKRNRMISNKPPKPPRPPRGPTLDAADMKLVKEISELAMLKRTRIERVKALKKVKTEKGLSFNTSLFAMVVSVLFCFMIFLQGLLGSHA